MLTKICKELNNWFDKNKIFGEFTIENGELIGASKILQEGQYFRIVGSVFNDGVHLHGSEDLEDEHFDGAVWTMAVPPSVIELSERISDWQGKYGGIDSLAMSPFQSESFGGYSYTKSGGSSDSNSGPSWKDVFANELNQWRKI